MGFFQNILVKCKEQNDRSVPFTTHTPISDHVPILKEPEHTTTSHLAGQNVSKRRERVVKCFVINGFIQVLDEDIANP